MAIDTLDVAALRLTHSMKTLLCFVVDRKFDGDKSLIILTRPRNTFYALVDRHLVDIYGVLTEAGKAVRRQLVLDGYEPGDVHVP